MPGPSGPLVGRSEELEELSGALRNALAGQGGLTLLAGEAGMGKSRLCEALATEAHREGVRVLWGRCWEAGGAPPFWPFVQVFRELWYADADGTCGPVWAHGHEAALAQLVPELASSGAETRGSVPPGQARFLLLDGLCAALLRAARLRPTLLLLEDLHVADEASLALLDAVALPARGAPLMVLGSHRDAAGYAANQALAQLGRRARTLGLSPLGLAEVRQYLAALAQDIDADTLKRIHSLSEGNALFLVESVRAFLRRGPSALSAAALAKDAGLSPLLEARLRGLSKDTRALLELASVCGREAPIACLEALRGVLAEPVVRGDAVHTARAEALDASLIEATDGLSLRFSHVLVGEALYQGLPEAQRRHLHGAVAGWLERLPTSDAAHTAQLGHHLREAGPAARPRALEVTLQVARHDLTVLAFEAAASSFAKALSLLDGAETGPRAELLLELAQALLLAGQHGDGWARAEEAARLFTSLGDAAGFARAALVRGTQLRFARVDPGLVAMLGEAKHRIAGQDPALEARVLARLSAANQPSLSPEVGIAQAFEAIAMARTQGDPRLLLDVLFTASSAIVDLTDAKLRRPINAEHADLAEREGDSVAALRAHTRHVFDCFELGDFEAQRRSMARVAHHAEKLGHRLYHWLPVAFSAAQALYEGAQERAEQHLRELQAMADAGHPDPNLVCALRWQRVRLARLTGSEPDIEARVAELRGELSGSPEMDAFGRLFALTEIVYCAPAPLDVDFAPADAQLLLGVGDVTALSPMAQWAFLREDVTLARELATRLDALSHSHGSLGVMAMVWDGPLALARGLLASCLGEHARAERLLQQGFELAVEGGAEPAAARTALFWALAHGRRGGTGDAAALQAAIARSLASARAEPQVVARLREVSATARIAAPAVTSPAERSDAVPHLRLTLDGEHYRLETERDSHALKATKGVRWLAALLAEPGREFHVLTLSHDAAGSGVVDRGDAGSVLDAAAVRAYRARLTEIDAELEEAEAMHDLGRLERAGEERQALLSQLAAGVDRAGGLRRDKGSVERARVNVQRRLRDAISRVEELDAASGRHLRRSVRTGVVCVYDPG